MAEPVHPDDSSRGGERHRRKVSVSHVLLVFSSSLVLYLGISLVEQILVALHLGELVRRWNDESLETLTSKRALDWWRCLQDQPLLTCTSQFFLLKNLSVVSVGIRVIEVTCGAMLLVGLSTWLQSKRVIPRPLTRYALVCFFIWLMFSALLELSKALDAFDLFNEIGAIVLIAAYLIAVIIGFVTRGGFFLAFVGSFVVGPAMMVVLAVMTLPVYVLAVFLTWLFGPLAKLATVVGSLSGLAAMLRDSVGKSLEVLLHQRVERVLRTLVAALRK